MKLSSLFSQKHLWTLGSLRKLYLFRNVFTQGKVGVANGKVAVACKTKYLFLLLFGSEYPACPRRLAGDFRQSPGLTEISVDELIYVFNSKILNTVQHTYLSVDMNFFTAPRINSTANI